MLSVRFEFSRWDIDLEVSPKHCTPKGVPVVLSVAIYKHRTPPE